MRLLWIDHFNSSKKGFMIYSFCSIRAVRRYIHRYTLPARWLDLLVGPHQSTCLFTRLESSLVTAQVAHQSTVGVLFTRGAAPLAPPLLIATIGLVRTDAWQHSIYPFTVGTSIRYHHYHSKTNSRGVSRPGHPCSVPSFYTSPSWDKRDLWI